MRSLKEQALAFGQQKRQQARRAGQLAALQLLCGIDLEEAFASEGAARAKLLDRMERLLERERLRGLRRHRNYDLNRHIALKQARDRLRGERRPISSVACAPGAMPA